MADDVRTPLEVRAQRGRRAELLDRLTSQYVEEGIPQLQARARALSDIARADMKMKYSLEPVGYEYEAGRTLRGELSPEPGYSGQAGSVLARAQEADRLRRNPRELAAYAPPVDPGTLPGYDPTRASMDTSGYRYDPITRDLMNGRGQPEMRFSRPMTQEDINIARMTSPLPAAQPPGIVERAMSVVRAGGPEQAVAAAPVSYATPAQSQAGQPSAGPMGTEVGGFDRMAMTPGQMAADAARQFDLGTGSRLIAPPQTAEAARRFDMGVASAPARAVQMARQASGVPTPPQRPDALAPQPPSHEAALAARSNAIQDAWKRYNESGNAADFVRASELMKGNAPQAEARGGAIKPKGGSAKPDAIHKALEIIHHLLMRER